MRKNKRTKPPSSKNQITKTQPTTPQRNGVVASISKSESFSGPLPHPDHLARYNDTIPNGAERILLMAEKQQDHRIYLEKYVIEHDSGRAYLGLWLAFATTIVIVAGGVYLISINKDASGMAVIILQLGGLLTVFLQTKKTRERERETKS